MKDLENSTNFEKLKVWKFDKLPNKNKKET